MCDALPKKGPHTLIRPGWEDEIFGEVLRLLCL